MGFVLNGMMWERLREIGRICLKIEFHIEAELQRALARESSISLGTKAADDGAVAR